MGGNNGPFHLTESFLEPYKSRQPDWGYGILSFITYRRTYSRIKPDGSYEEWWETIKRIVESTFSTQQYHCEQNNLPWSPQKAQKSAQDAYDIFFNMKALPAGRGLANMGTEVIEKKGSIPLYSCAFVSTEDISKDLAYPFCYMMDLSMLGVGVTFDLRGAGTFLLKKPKIKSEEVFVIPDSREGWVQSIKVIFDAFSNRGYLPGKFDYSQLRAEGAILNTMGGTSSGPDSLKELHSFIISACSELVANQTPISSTAITDMMNYIGRIVVSGGVRRTAQAALGEIDDEDFIDLKNPTLHPTELREWRYASNNSLFMKVGMDYSNVAERIGLNGEPGLLWLDNMRNYGRLKDGWGDWDPEVYGCNPCQPAWATVLTPDGISTIGQIQEGDTIWSGKRWTKVLKKWSTGIKTVNAYKTTAGVFNGTENHKVVSEGIKVEAKDAESIDTSVCSDSFTLDRDPKIIMDGLVIGDGGVHTASNYLVGLYIGERDQDYFNSEVKDLIKKYRPGISPYFYEIDTNIKADELPRTYERKIPSRYIYNCLPNGMAAFLRGLFSANGSVAGDRVTLKASSLNIIRDVQLMLSSLGIKSYITTNKSNTIKFSNGEYTCKQSYDLNISSDRIIFRDIIGFIQKYKNEALNSVIARKQKAQLKPKTTFEITEVEFISEEEVFDITVEDEDHTYWTGGLLVSNCFEISLLKSGTCNLNEVFLNRLDTPAEFHKALKAAYLYSKTVTLIPTHRPEINAIIGMDRRIGCSVGGIAQAIQKFGYRNLTKMLDDGYSYLRNLDKIYSRWLCIPTSIKVSTLKPSGSISLLTGASPGVHYPIAEYYIRRVRFDKYSLLPALLEKAGYKIEESIQKDDTLIVEFPIHEQYFYKSRRDVSLWEQMALVRDMQYYWSDNQVSATITVREEEKKEIKRVLEVYETQLKSISMLPLDTHGYAQAPYEAITKEQYEEMMSHIQWSPQKIMKEVSKKVEKDQEEKYCDGETCQLK